MSKAWKSAEMRVARLFGSERTGPTGRDDNDFIHALIAPEVKYRKSLPFWALTCLEQARTAKSAAGKVPCVFMLQRGMRLRDGLVVMTIRNFEQLYGRIDSPASDEAEKEKT